jgi:hypothetical protein
MSTDTNVIVLESLSKKEKANLPAGTRFFVQRTGSYGTVLADPSGRGKKRAEMTCTLGGPNHIREISDWHQCGVSPEMKKAPKKAKKAESSVDTIAAAEAVRAELEAKLAKAQEEAGIVDDEDETFAEAASS